MKIIVREKIRELEEKIFKGYSFWFFKGYVAVEKRGVEKIIDDIYASLPTDMQKAREFLKEHDIKIKEEGNKNNIYEILKMIELFLEDTTFLTYSIISKDDLQNLTENLKNSIPDEIYQAEKYDN